MLKKTPQKSHVSFIIPCTLQSIIHGYPSQQHVALDRILINSWIRKDHWVIYVLDFRTWLEFKGEQGTVCQERHSTVSFYTLEYTVHLTWASNSLLSFRMI